MKLSTKIILSIILISAMLILLNSCSGTVPDDSPSYTPGFISGTMTRPAICCEDTQGELVGDPMDPNICEELCDNVVDWYAWADVEVVLTTWVDSEEIELATTVTDENGNYFFNDVPPGKNYIITAICPTDEEFVVKDVAEEVVGGETYNAGIADAESTVLALCLEGLGEMGLDSELIDLDDFQSHASYKRVICEVCGYLADCEYAIPLWVCELTGLCPGWTPTGVDDDDDDDAAADDDDDTTDDDTTDDDTTDDDTTDDDTTDDDTTDDDDGHSNQGHGNNQDGVDSSNPGQGQGGPGTGPEGDPSEDDNPEDDENR
jgi:hypothetical protein